MPASTYGRQVVIAATNKSGGQLILGDVAVVDTTNNLAFTTSTAGAVSNLIIAVAMETIANNATGRFLTSGYASLVNVNASVTRGNFGKTHTVAKQATDAGASRVAGTFVQFTTGGTTPDGIVYPSDLGGASLTNPMTTGGDIIYGASAGAPARLANGTAYQFLQSAGGTSAPVWASLTTASANMNTGSTTLSTSFADIGGLSITCAAGTWLFFTNLLFEAVGATRSIYAKTWDGTTVFDEMEGSCASGFRMNVDHISIPITLGGSTTVKVSAKCDAGASNTVDRDGGASSLHYPTNIVALRIA